jgi:hypothetical protein
MRRNLTLNRVSILLLAAVTSCSSRLFVRLNFAAFFRVVSWPRSMFRWLAIICGTVAATIRCRHDLANENLALRQQLAVMKYQCRRTRLTDADCFFWVVLSRIWSGWYASLQIVQPVPVIRWHW